MDKWIMTENELERIEYDACKGFYLNDFIFDSLLGLTDTCLSLEDSIQTTQNVIITWTIGEGWIVIPINEQNNFDFFSYMPLSLYLNVTFNKNIPVERHISSKEELIDENIDILKERIRLISSYLAGNTTMAIDHLIFIIKEHRHPEVQNAKQLLITLQNELEEWYIAKRKLLEYSTFDCNALIPKIQRTRKHFFY